MTVREFFTGLLAQIEDMNVLEFVFLLAMLVVVIVGGWRWIRDLRKTSWHEIAVEWRRASAEDRPRD